MKELPSNALSIKWRNVLTGLFIAMLTAAFTAFLHALGINDDGTIGNFHLPTKADFIKSLYAGFAGGMMYIFHKYVENSVPAAEKTIAEAQAKVIAKQNS